MSFLRRIHCHFCGTRSQYSKSSGVGEFQCTSCEAVNFLDRRGNILDTPASAVAQSQHRVRDQSPPFQTFSQDLPETLGHQQSQAFCNTCLMNQRLYTEAISNYLPDEEHPRYQEFEDALPQFKKQLEGRYPQVCKRCAPKAQKKINRADYYAGTQNINRLAKQASSRGYGRIKGARDDWWKWTMRLLLGILGLALYASLVLQVAWHVYGIFVARSTAMSADDVEDAGLAFDPTPRDCFQDALHMRLSQTCHQILSAYIPRALLVSTLLIWCNPGLRHWYHHTVRIEAVGGQTEHFRLQLVLLVVRAAAWYKLSDPSVTLGLSTQQLMAAHGFVALFTILVQWLSNRAIKPIKFRLRQKMMPSPEQRDVLSALAGPETEDYTSQASSIPPSQLFARDRITPFPIANLAPQQSTRNKVTGMPSPPPSDETDEDGDPMELDDGPTIPSTKVDRTYRPKQAQKRTTFTTRSSLNHGRSGGAGWSGMRDELFGMQDTMQAETERMQQQQQEKTKLKYQPVQPSPFRGRLPSAPMSMERKLRNPVTQLAFKETPVSKQQNFMQQMRNGIEQGRMFGRQPAETRQTQQRAEAQLLPRDEEDKEFSPVKSRTRGGLELKQSAWQLQSDLATGTGLEDLFGGNTFRIDDEPAITLPSRRRDSGNGTLKLVLGVVMPVLVMAAAVGWNALDIRKVVCLWMVDRLEDMGY